MEGIVIDTTIGIDTILIIVALVVVLVMVLLQSSKVNKRNFEFNKKILKKNLEHKVYEEVSVRGLAVKNSCQCLHDGLSNDCLAIINSYLENGSLDTEQEKRAESFSELFSDAKVKLNVFFTIYEANVFILKKYDSKMKTLIAAIGQVEDKITPLVSDLTSNKPIFTDEDSNILKEHKKSVDVLLLELSRITDSIGELFIDMQKDFFGDLFK